MLLRSLQPRSATDLTQLKGLLDGRGWRATLPSALPDAVLLHLARDLRAVECVLAGESDEEPPLAPAMYVVLELLLQHPNLCERSDLNLELSQEAIMDVLHAYQWALEREIVTRVVGIGPSNDSASLLKAIENAVKL